MNIINQSAIAVISNNIKAGRKKIRLRPIRKVKAEEAISAKIRSTLKINQNA